MGQKYGGKSHILQEENLIKEMNMTEDNALLFALKRTLQQVETDADRQLVSEAVLAGKFAAVIGRSSMSSDTGGVATVGDLTDSIIVTGDHNQLFLTLPQDTVALLQKRIFPTPPGVPPPPIAQLLFVGREKDMLQIKQDLGIHRSSGQTPGPQESSTQNREAAKRVLIVRGWPGVGKTTLVAMLGRDPSIAQVFPDGVLWTVVDQEPRPLAALARWGRALGTDSLMRAATLSEAMEQMQELLHDKRMLLIVDDVWYSNDAMPFLQVAGQHCSVLVTTRITKVADQLDAAGYNTRRLPELEEEDAYRLLELLAPAVAKSQPKECHLLVRKLECLPLAIHVAGRMLSSQARRGWHVDVARFLEELEKDARLLQEQAPSDRAEHGRTPTIQALLQKSTDMLSEQAREYFAFLGAFAPKPATFDLEAMDAIWEDEDPRSTADILIDHGLLEPVALEPTTSDFATSEFTTPKFTDPARFQMHALLVSHARSLYHLFDEE